MEQHPVPRNISSFQFHLVGDMTIRQFLYLAAGAFIGFLIVKYAPLNGLFKWPLAAMPFFSGLAFAFLPIQERPLDKWLVAFIRSINSPTQYVWHKDSEIPEILLRSISTTVKAMPASHQVEVADAKKKLDNYLSTLPVTPHQTINTRESNYVNKTLELFSSVNSGSGTSMNPGIIQPANNPVNIPIRPVKIDNPRPSISTIKTVPQKIHVAEETNPVKDAAAIPKITPVIIKPQVIPVDQATTVKPIQPVKTTAVSNTTVIPGTKPIVMTTPAIVTTQIKPTPVSEPKPNVEPLTQTVASQIKPEATPVPKVISAPVTQSGISQVKPAAITQPKPNDAPVSDKEGEEKIKKMILEKQQLEVELSKLKEELTAKREDKTIIKPVVSEEKQPTIKTVTPKTAVNEIGIPKLPQVPNIIMGVIKDRDGKLLPNIILTIKDLNDIPHRALKTNRLGQFSTATQLQNGTYHIEAEDPLKRYVFDIAEIVLNGKIFLPIEIDAKGEKELMREKLTKEIFGGAASV